MIRDFNYVFLDVGNVLFHDSAVEMVFYYLIYQQLTPSAKNAFFSTREKALYRGNIGWIYEYCSENRLDSDGNINEHNPFTWKLNGKMLNIKDSDGNDDTYEISIKNNDEKVLK